MRKQPGSGVAPFALLTAGLFLFTACYVVDDEDAHRRCRAAGTSSMVLVSAVDARGGNGGSSGGGPSVRKPAPASARPAPAGPVRKDPPRAPATGPHADGAPTATPRTPTPTPTPSRTGRCKGAR